MVTHSAHEIAAEIRKRLPGVPVKKLHKLLYYCQGHHLAAFGEPLFSEAVSAWDMGPVVGQLWWEERQGQPKPVDGIRLGEGELNTVGYVLSRYGRLSGLDLEHLTHSEPPWIDADNLRRQSGVPSQKIPRRAMQEFFASAADPDDESEPPLDERSVAMLLRGAGDRLSDQPSTDSPEAILARVSA